jgi:hypothetical protein
MRFDLRPKLVKMIPARKITSGTVSAKTYGTGGHVNSGIVDTNGYDIAVVEISQGIKGGGTAQKIKKLCLGFQSGAASVFTAVCGCTVLSGLTSGAIISAKTATGVVHRAILNLNAGAQRKRYLNALLITSGGATSAGGVFEVRCYLHRPTAFPQASTATGYATTTEYGM